MSKKCNRSDKYTVTQNCIYVIKDAIKTYPVLLVCALFISGLSVLLSLLWTYMPATVVQGIEEKWDVPRMALSVAGFILGMVLLHLIIMYLTATHTVYKSNYRQQYILRVNSKIMKCRYQTLESAEVQSKIDQVADLIFPDSDSLGISAVLAGSLNLLLTVVGIASCVTILQQLSGWIALFVLAVSLINTWFTRLADRYIKRHRDEWMGADRKISYINEKLVMKEYAKDIRAYRCEDWILDRLESVIAERGKWIKKVLAYNNRLGWVRLAVNLVYDVVIMAHAVIAVLNGTITISEFVLYIGLIAELSGFMSRFFGAFGSLIAGANDVQVIREFLEQGDDGEETKESVKKIASDAPGIRFENVSFCYEEGEKEVISNLNLCIKKGEKVAVVGENGAGKTTLVKLMCGLYRPTAGQIYIDDVPLDQYSLEDVYRMFSTVFQDFIVFPFSVAQNVAMTEKENVDRDLVRKCLEDVGLDVLASDMDRNLVSEAHDDGIDLSGGQTQRMLIARAVYKNATILLLDEPTAALDAIAESELYEKYNELAKDKTSLFISHRLASTRFCDRILFLKNGKISEEGTHEQLLAADKEYAQLYKLQSQYYN
ncbi:MAG: ABC transporter ATP-binding protein [Lachnospiraceae bacterium]|nr:ABC transporter ATP-binding protein [Lachnospiraceae bacterium]